MRSFIQQMWIKHLPRAKYSVYRDEYNVICDFKGSQVGGLK